MKFNNTLHIERILDELNKNTTMTFENTQVAPQNIKEEALHKYRKEGKTARV